LINKSKQDLDVKWKEFEEEIVKDSPKGPIFAFIYYSGNGFTSLCKFDGLEYSHTSILHGDSDPKKGTNIEIKLRQLSKVPNVMVISFIDCGRKRIHLGNQINPMNLEVLSLYIGFGARDQRPAKVG